MPTFAHKALESALALLCKAAPKRRRADVLACARVSVADGAAALAVYDLEQALTVRLPCQATGEVAFLVDCHALLALVKSACAPVTINPPLDGATRALVESGGLRGEVKSPPLDDWPVLPVVSPTAVSLPTGQFAAALGQVAHAMCTEETRYYLNGVFVHAHGDGLRFVATNGHRLAYQTINADQPAWPASIIPRAAVRTLLAMSRVKGAAPQITLGSDGRAIYAATGDIVLVSRLIDGAFPDYERVIPASDEEKRLTVNKAALAAALKSMVAQFPKSEAAPVRFRISRDGLVQFPKSEAAPVRFRISRDGLALSCRDVSQAIPCQWDAPPLDIGFNGQYVLDMLAACEGADVIVALSDSGSPARVDDPSGAVFVLMPLWRLS